MEPHSGGHSNRGTNEPRHPGAAQCVPVASLVVGVEIAAALLSEGVDVLLPVSGGTADQALLLVLDCDGGEVSQQVDHLLLQLDELQ